MLYFGYGSNLHRDDLRRWCEARGHRHEGIRPLGCAWLPDTEPVFHYLSRVRRGGALSIRPRRGSAVPGVLFEVDERSWEALDDKEGTPVYYRRVERLVLTPGGEEVRALTYEVVDEKRVPEHVPPTAEYERAVREGLRSFGLPEAQLRAAARGFDVPALPRAIFVYGTLLRGQQRHGLLRRHGPRSITAGACAGRLIDLGDYPGLVPCERGGRVRGELVELDDPKEALDELDEVEDFAGYGRAGNLYRRVVTPVRAADGGSKLAWTYRYVGPSAAGPPIASGDWLRR